MITRKAALNRLISELKATLKFAMHNKCGDIPTEKIELFADELRAARELSVSKETLDINEACAELGGISPATFYNWIGRGRLPEGKKKKEVVVWNKEDIKNAKQYIKC